MIVIPAAGEGRRFAEAGYEGPKHLLPLNGKTMIEYVIENVRPLDPDGEVRVVTQETVGQTRGAVETILRGAEDIDPHEPLVVANCDQLLKIPDFDWLGDGTVFTFPSANPAHSYVTCGDGGNLIFSIMEKVVTSDRAVSGVYCFSEPTEFLHACETLLERASNRELYVSAAISLMLEWGADLFAVDAPTAILGTPEDFQRAEVAASVFGCGGCKCAC